MSVYVAVFGLVLGLWLLRRRRRRTPDHIDGWRTRRRDDVE